MERDELYPEHAIENRHGPTFMDQANLRPLDLL